jgi:hypothetical protein
VAAWALVLVGARIRTFGLVRKSEVWIKTPFSGDVQLCAVGLAVVRTYQQFDQKGFAAV